MGAISKIKIGSTTYDLSNTGRNLLDNWDFRAPINQRGLTSYTAHGYTIDRWYIPFSGANITIGDGYTTCEATVHNYVLYQHIAEGLLEDSTDYTVSMLFADGTLVTGTGDTSAEFHTNYYNGWVAGLLKDGTQNAFFLACTAANVPANIVAVKLEKGATSTLENDAPANKLQELQKCQQYYQKVIIGGAANSTYLGGVWFLPVPMRTPDATLTLGAIGTSNGIVTIVQGGIFLFDSGKSIKLDCLVSADAGYFFAADVTLESEL